MKKFRLIAVAAMLFFGATTLTQAQDKIAHIDTQALVEAMPEMKAAESQLEKLQKTAGIIHSELATLGERFAEFEETDSEEKDMALQSELADLYSRTVSFMSPRIIVQGSSGRLQDPVTVSRVRTALFSGIRAAFMWHQFGGRRIHLLFSRGRYAALARSLVNN